MDAALRRAWTEIVTADDYEAHMAALGQAQAAAELTVQILHSQLDQPGGTEDPRACACPQFSRDLQQNRQSQHE